MEEEYLKLFDKVFETTNVQKYVDLKNIPLLSILYDRVSYDITTNSETYKKLRKKKIKVLDELSSTFTEKQREIFEEYCDIGSQIDYEMERQTFIFGYIFATELNRECKKGE